MSAPAAGRGAPENVHPDGTRLGPGRQAAREVAEGLRADPDHPLLVACRRASARLTAAAVLATWRRRRAAEPPAPWVDAREVQP